MTLVDYTGKLNNHDDYLHVLKHLEHSCKYLEYVLVDEADTAFLKQFEHLILTSKQKNKWWGTKSGGKSKWYRLKSSQDVFRYCKQFATFCKYINTDMGDVAIETDFGINDIAFFDDHELPLLYTTTHEGYIMIRSDFLCGLERR